MHTTIQELIYTVNGAEAIFLQLYLNNNLIVKINCIANWLESSLNLFYAIVNTLNMPSIKIQYKKLELTIFLFTPVLYFISAIYLFMDSSVLLSVLLLYLVFFKTKFIAFNSFILDILHDDSSNSSDGDTTSSDSDESSDTNVDDNDQDDSLDDNEYPMLLIKLELALFDVKGIINTLVAYRRSQDESNEECPAVDAFIEKIMHSPDISCEDLSHLEKFFKPKGLSSIKQKLLNLNKKRLYSPKEILKLILNLNKLKNSMLILPNGIIILTQHKTNLSLLSLPSILKVSRRNLKHIINMLNLNKKLNLYLTKECYKSGDLWEKSFYVADFLCKLDEKFNKNYLILEEIAPHFFKETKLKIDSLECDDLIFEETIFVLEQISKKFSYKYDLKKNSSCPLEGFVGEVLSNQISMDVVLENIINIKKTPPKVITTKITWKQYFKNFLNYLKRKWQDLTIPAITVYYYLLKLIFFTSLKYLIILIIFLWFLYKYVYLNKSIWTKLQFAAWFLSLGAYLYFLWILFFGNVYWISRSVFYYVKFYFKRFLLFDFILISLIYFSYVCLNLIYLTDCIFILWYNILIYIYSYLLIKINFYTLLSIYLSPFWYVYANIKIFISYAWGISYYRDPFICYFSKILALWYLYLFPYLVNVEAINAGKISSLLRWLNWNRHFFSILKKFIFYCINLIYEPLKITICFWLEDLMYFYHTWFLDFFVSYLLLYFFLYVMACILLFYLFLWYFSLKNKQKDYKGFQEYCDFSNTFGDRVKEKMFDLIPLRYKLSWEFLNIEWLKILNNSFLFYIKYINIMYVFVAKKLWLYIKNTIYSRFKESLVEFYCEMHLWIEYYMFKYLGDFLELYFYIPYYVKVTTIYVTEIVWLTFMDMHMLVKFFGIKPLIYSIEAYVRYRASLLKYQYWFWKNYQYQYNRKRLCYQHAFILFYWNLYLKFQYKQRLELNNRILKSWYIWWIQNKTDF